jgi:hypothetical protein
MQLRGVFERDNNEKEETNVFGSHGMDETVVWTGT